MFELIINFISEIALRNTLVKMVHELHLFLNPQRHLSLVVNIVILNLLILYTDIEYLLILLESLSRKEITDSFLKIWICWVLFSDQ